MKPSKHAIKRWAERFTNMDMQSEFDAARLTTDAENKEILKTCPNHKRFKIRPNIGRYYLTTPNAIFVMGGVQKHVLTVLERNF